MSRTVEEWGRVAGRWPVTADDRAAVLREVAEWLDQQAAEEDACARQTRWNVARQLAEERSLAPCWAADEIRSMADRGWTPPQDGGQ